MLSKPQFGSNPALTEDKQAMPENTRFDGPAGLETSSKENEFAANLNEHLAKPGFSG